MIDSYLISVCRPNDAIFRGSVKILFDSTNPNSMCLVYDALQIMEMGFI